MRRILLLATLFFSIAVASAHGQSKSTAQPAGAKKAPAKAKAKAPIEDGTYASTNGNYRIAVQLTAGVMTVVEPNETSAYARVGTTNVYQVEKNGKQYALEILPDKTLKASKPGSGDAPTILKRVGPASALCVAEPIDVNGEKQYGIRMLPKESATLEGRYQYEGGHPEVVLGAGGKGGVYEVHGAPKPEYVHAIEEWWVQANCDGTPYHQFPANPIYILIFKFQKPVDGNLFKRVNLRIDQDPAGKMYILGERVKNKS